MAHIPRAVCLTCNVEMVQTKTGIIAEALLADGQPYYKVETDRLKCPSCGIEILAGFAKLPFAEHYWPEYDETQPADTQFNFAGELPHEVNR